MRTSKQLFELVHADAERNRCPHRTPQRVPSSDPVPEAKHVVRCNPELLNRRGVGTDGNEVLGHCCLVLQCVHQPLPSGASVHHRLLRGECLRAHEEEGGLRVQPLERFRYVRAVDVRNKLHFELRGVRLECFRYHDRAEVRATDADVDGVRELLAREAHALSRSHLGDERAHAGKDVVDGRHDVGALHQDWGVGAVTKRNVQHRAAFSGINNSAAEHSIPPLSNPCFLCERDEELHGLLRDPVLAVVQENVAHLEAELLESLGVPLEERAHVHILDGHVVALER
mmetsp:Transcript_47568/g.97268  ORF Transcript_47568/g.97268 Transcript_47568/m.97268 type:complete len:285 (-) Transcript_47568:56-910(-)